MRNCSHPEYMIIITIITLNRWTVLFLNIYIHYTYKVVPRGSCARCMRTGPLNYRGTELPFKTEHLYFILTMSCLFSLQ